MVVFSGHIFSLVILFIFSVLFILVVVVTVFFFFLSQILIFVALSVRPSFRFSDLTLLTRQITRGTALPAIGLTSTVFHFALFSPSHYLPLFVWLCSPGIGALRAGIWKITYNDSQPQKETNYKCFILQPLEIVKKLFAWAT